MICGECGDTLFGARYAYKHMRFEHGMGSQEAFDAVGDLLGVGGGNGDGWLDLHDERVFIEERYGL